MTPFLFVVSPLPAVQLARCLVAGVVVDLALAHLAPCKTSFLSSRSHDL